MVLGAFAYFEDKKSCISYNKYFNMSDRVFLMISRCEVIIRRGFWKECLLWIVSFLFFLLLGTASLAAYFMFASTVLFMFDNTKSKKISNRTIFLVFLSLTMCITALIYNHYFIYD